MGYNAIDENRYKQKGGVCRMGLIADDESNVRCQGEMDEGRAWQASSSCHVTLGRGSVSTSVISTHHSPLTTGHATIWPILSARFLCCDLVQVVVNRLVVVLLVSTEPSCPRRCCQLLWLAGHDSGQSTS